MQDRYETSRMEFNIAVKAFEKKYRNNIGELLKNNNFKFKQSFWTNPIIISYLSRASICFKDEHPLLIPSLNQTDYETSDHYELEVYKAFPDLVPFRNEFIVSPEFYASGTKKKDNGFF